MPCDGDGDGEDGLCSRRNQRALTADQQNRFLNADPVFWMHHAEIDRIWADWQAANPGQNPSLAGAAAIMDPWPEDEEATRDITALGYAYV